MSNELSAHDLLPSEIGLTLMGFEKSEQAGRCRLSNGLLDKFAISALSRRSEASPKTLLIFGTGENCSDRLFGIRCCSFSKRLKAHGRVSESFCSECLLLLQSSGAPAAARLSQA
jgi:hypothetical protein